MRPRPKGSQFNPEDLSAFLKAFGDDLNPLPSTIQCLDSIITDYIIETCHEASLHATYSGRAKVKQDDFQWALRKDARKLGRVQELLLMEKELKDKRRTFDVEERDAAGALVVDPEDQEGPRKGVGRGRGRRKKRKVEDEGGAAGAAAKAEDVVVKTEERRSSGAGMEDDGVDALFGDDDD